MAFSTNRKLNIAYAHSLSKINEREDQNPYESSKQGGHNVQGNLVWGDNVPFASNYTQADLNVTNYPTIIKKYTQFPLTPIPGSNSYAWYLNDNGAYIRNWLDEVSVIDTSGNLSYGYVIRLYQNNGIQIPADMFNIDPYAGVVLWNTGQNPIELGYSLPIKITCYVYIGESVNQKIQNIKDSLTWQAPVLSKLKNDPSLLTPNIGDRYIVNSPALNDWVAKENQIATYTSTGWVFLEPLKGFTCYVLDESLTYNFNGSQWVNIGGTNLAKNIVTNTTFFNYLLSPNEDNVQKALNVLDKTIYKLNTIFKINNNITISIMGLYEIDTTAGDITILLDDILSINERYYPVIIKKIDNSSNKVIITSSQNIGNSTSQELSNINDTLYLISDYNELTSEGRWTILYDNRIFFDKFSALNNQTLYHLSKKPNNPEKSNLYINGIKYKYNTDYTIINDNLTLILSSLNFSIDEGDIIEISYQ